MPKIDVKLTATMPNDFQKREIIKKIIVSMGMSLHMFAIAHTMENKADSIPFHVSNTMWSQKTELMASVYYEEKPEPVNFSLILGGVSSTTESPMQSMFLERGKIKKIFLLLQNYYKKPRNISPTLLGSLDFKPESLDLKEITFKIEIFDGVKQISPNPVYANLTPKLEKNNPEKREIK